MESALPVAVRAAAHQMQSVPAADFPACVEQPHPPFDSSALKIALSYQRSRKMFSHGVGFKYLLIKYETRNTGLLALDFI